MGGGGFVNVNYGRNFEKEFALGTTTVKKLLLDERACERFGFGGERKQEKKRERVSKRKAVHLNIVQT